MDIRVITTNGQDLGLFQVGIDHVPRIGETLIVNKTTWKVENVIHRLVREGDAFRGESQGPPEYIVHA